MKQLGLALHNYHDTRQRFPFGFSSRSANDGHALLGGTASANSTEHAWVEFVLPFIDQAPLYNKLNFSLDNFNSANADLLNGRIYPFMSCPSNPYASSLRPAYGAGTSFESTVDYFWETGVACYAISIGPCGDWLGNPTADCVDVGSPNYCSGSGTVYFAGSVTETYGMFGNGLASTNLASVTDGTSNTFMMCERKGEGTPGNSGTPLGMFSHGQGCSTGWKLNTRKQSPDRENHLAASSHHVGGGHFLMGDGSVRFVGNNINFETYNYLGGRSEGQVIGEF